MPRKFVDANDHPIIQPPSVDLPATGGIETVRDTINEIEPVTDMYGFKSHAEALAFNEEKLKVLIHESNDINPENHVQMSVNGQYPAPYLDGWVPRGVPVILARKFVEVLLRAKPISIRTVDARDRDGSMTTRIQRTASLKYPFSVLEDPNPKGAKWLSTLMAQA